MNIKQHLTWKNASVLLFTIYAVIIFLRAAIGGITWAEIDSNALPVISLQYRLSTTCNQSDLAQAQVDFPNMYQGIASYEDLRSAKLVYADENTWVPYYFPVYPAFCIPVKLLLSFLNLDQERTFPLTNALLLLSSLFCVLKTLKTDERNRFFVLAFLMASPIFFNLNYVNYEVFIFSFLVLSATQYVNGRRRLSALLLSVAGMPNQAVMAAGIIMILYYATDVIVSHIKQNGRIRFCIIKENIRYCTVYACCFLPCLLPSVWRSVRMAGDVFAGGAFDGYAAERFWAYITDINLGVFSFGLLQILLTVILFVYLIFKKDFSSLIFGLGFFGMLAGVSLAIAHICCGMQYCARYVTWAYALLAFFLGMNAAKLFRANWHSVIPVLLCLISVCVMQINAMNWDIRIYTSFNYFSSRILNSYPEWYNPIKSVFVSRVYHIDGNDGCYDYESLPVTYYCDTSGSTQNPYVRKILFRAEKEQISQIRQELTGSQEALDWLSAKLETYDLDGKYHYLNINRKSPCQLRIKTPEEAGKLAEAKQLALLKNITLTKQGAGMYYYAHRISIKENTYYKIELSLPDALRQDKGLIIDFYEDGYDNAEQEANSFALKNVKDYVFYWYSGDLGAETRDIWLRCYYFSEEPELDLTVDYLRCTEMTEILSNQ